MGNGKGLGGLIVLLGLAFLFSQPSKGEITPSGWYERRIRERIIERELPHVRIIRERGIVMPTFPTYPQVNGAGPRIDPTIVDYEEALAAKYPDELEATRVSYAATRKVLGLRQYTAPPLPRTAGGLRPGRITR